MRLLLLCVCTLALPVTAFAEKARQKPALRVRYVTAKEFPRITHQRKALEELGRSVSASSEGGRVETFAASQRNNVSGPNHRVLAKGESQIFEFAGDKEREAAIRVENVNTVPGSFHFNLMLAETLPVISLIARPKPSKWNGRLELALPNREVVHAVRALELLAGENGSFELLTKSQYGALWSFARNAPTRPAWQTAETRGVELVAPTETEPFKLTIDLASTHVRKLVHPGFGMIEFLFEMTPAE